MLIPKYTITDKILRNIGIIEACREAIENAPMIPAYERSFQDEAMLRTVHYGTHIEGNELSLAEARKVVESRREKRNKGDRGDKGNLLASKAGWGESRDVQEVINYRRVMKYIEGLVDGKWEVGGESGSGKREVRIFSHFQPPTSKPTSHFLPTLPFFYTQDQLLKIYTLTVERILPEQECGKFREIQVVAKNSQTGQVVLRYPPAVEVPFQINGFLSWLDSPEGRSVHPVLRAGITHYFLSAIHPFVEGNGRVSRAFATLVLFAEGYDIKKLFSLEEYFDKNAADYFGKLKEISDQDKDISKRDLTSWLEFFTEALSNELSRIKEKVKLLSFDGRFKKKQGGKQIVLSPRQLKLVEHLEVYEEMEMNTAKEILPMVSEDTILRDLQDLIKRGIIKKKGKTKGARYYVSY